ncbi:hypothetical protein HBI56_169080 [Parastagonospora nodorum]|uniref:Uncharacterized protein n=2 Tax=Phaeosphaeria nodorum (strain SN15 / ATCC MYA-4574 / FGSC 10173) TaxID=321614 RepID=A0A7U2FB18_PHANO|nr:hypothetical protein SNOG_04982 [Parastagonospora nodorum SN15]KAH3916942.1 hypothetical protein HBH56_049670 [Parastagonospora nodorum]EAT87373.1 hypothetical protein SNOG_04982 [Parastagonospora nodorum SN15]KAH3935403.1 hypothetical protein HBH54_035460 [Parastagonospora nodorum]KAH3942761.1 hypothetical protein HBH53_184520 [Parastagonospora nodorum]KAH3964123.1 hypothetical protein HBH51_161310 [Parastagonospora nodorum]
MIACFFAPARAVAQHVIGHHTTLVIVGPVERQEHQVRGIMNAAQPGLDSLHMRLTALDHGRWAISSQGRLA